MFEIFVLFVGTFGALAARGLPETFGTLGTLGTPYLPRNVTKHSEVVLSSLPGSGNLNEKAIPLSKLVAQEQFLSPGGQNLLEKALVPSKLPGTENLAEKRIPELILQKLSQPYLDIEQGDPQMIPFDETR